MKHPRGGSIAAAASSALLAVAIALLAGAAAPSASEDPLAAEIATWNAYLKSNTSKDEQWMQVKQATEPLLAGAEQALRNGRRLLALQRLGGARAYLSASRYLDGFSPEKQKDTAGFEAEWARMGGVLREELGDIPAGVLDGVQPAAVRAMGEAALPQIKGYYEASLEYGRNTMAQFGLFYIGSAQAQREFVALCRSLSAPSGRPAPPLRSLTPEIDRLEAELLSAYRPPASIDRHSEFIAASATLNEARELDDAGLRYGAMQRYLQASLRAAPLPPAGKSLNARAVAARLKNFETRMADAAFDNSIGQLWAEYARAELQAPTAKTPDPAPKAADTAAVIAEDILPRYFAALGPGKPAAPRPPPEVTVTLVRWPYT
jgi:hypothetical protein